MATMTEVTTDKRIDDLRSEMHRGFDRVESDCREIKADYRDLRSEMKAGFDRVAAEMGQVRSESMTEARKLRAEMNAGFESVRAEMNAGFESVNRLMIRFFAGTLGSIIAGVMVLLVSHS